MVATRTPDHVVDELLQLNMEILQKYFLGTEVRDLKPQVARRDALRKWLMMIVDTSGETPPPP